MQPSRYHECLHEALSKAFASRAVSVRLAYFDLASFYYEKIGAPQMYPNGDVLKSILAKRAA
jgi:hypothetical protein